LEAQCDSADVSAPSAEPPPLRIEEGLGPKRCRRSGDPDWHGEKFSNATHRSTTDPESRLYRKGANREAKLSYLGHYLSELTSGVIYQAMATQTTGTAEREAAIMMLDRCAVMPKELAADLGYRDGTFLAQVIERGIIPLVPLGEEKLEQEPVYRRATYNIEVARKRKQRVEAAWARNFARIAARGPRAPRAQRQRTRLEHLFGEAKEHHGLRRAYGRGLKRVDQQVKMTAAVQNIKRLMTSRHRRADAQAAALTISSWGDSANHMCNQRKGRQNQLNSRQMPDRPIVEPTAPRTIHDKAESLILHHASSLRQRVVFPIHNRSRSTRSSSQLLMHFCLFLEILSLCDACLTATDPNEVIACCRPVASVKDVGFDRTYR
jgi:hypothetical protein